MACTYADGTGLYQELYDRARATYPKDPSKHNTTPAQNLLGLVASMYVAHIDDGVPPLAFLRQHGGRYNITWLTDHLTLCAMLREFLTPDDAGCDARPGAPFDVRLDKLMDLAILGVYSSQDAPVLRARLAVLCACQM